MPNFEILIFDKIIQIYTDNAANRFIRQFQVNCPNYGCEWKGNLSSLSEVRLSRLNV